MMILLMQNEKPQLSKNGDYSYVDCIICWAAVLHICFSKKEKKRKIRIKEIMKFSSDLAK